MTLLLTLLFFVAFALFAIAIVLVGRVWYRILGEDLIIYTLKQNSGDMPYDAMVNKFPKGGNSALARLMQKGIIKTDSGFVHLLGSGYVCSFGEVQDSEET